jgi:hypothetical protein
MAETVVSKDKDIQSKVDEIWKIIP